MNAVTPMPIEEETEAYAERGDIVSVRIPARPLVRQDENGDRYISLQWSMSGGTVQVHIYGLAGPDLDRARGKPVSAVLQSIVTCTYANGRQSTHVAMRYAGSAAPTSRIIPYSRRSHFKRSPYTTFEYPVPKTDGFIEVRSCA